MTGWFWWLAGGGLVAAGLAVVVFWPVVVSLAATRFGRWAIAAGAAAIAVLGIFARGEAKGRAAEKQRQEKENADFLKRQERGDAALGRLSDDELDRRLRAHDGKPGAG